MLKNNPHLVTIPWTFQLTLTSIIIGNGIIVTSSNLAWNCLFHFTAMVLEIFKMVIFQADILCYLLQNKISVISFRDVYILVILKFDWAYLPDFLSWIQLTLFDPVIHRIMKYFSLVNKSLQKNSGRQRKKKICDLSIGLLKKKAGKKKITF